MSVTACIIILLLDDSIFIALTISSADAIESAVCDAWCMSTSADSINGTVSSVTTEGAGDGGLDILYTHVCSFESHCAILKIAGLGGNTGEGVSMDP